MRARTEWSLADRSREQPRERARERPRQQPREEPREQPGTRREFRRWVVLSAVAHVGLLGLVLAAPEGRRMTRPQAISVDLVALAPGGAPKPRPAPAAAKPAPPEPAAAPEPVPPPPPKPKEVVLPEKPRGPRPDPEPEAKPEPRRREVFIEPEPKQQEKSLEDLMSELREESGEPAESAEPAETAAADTSGPPGGGGGVPVSAEERDWRRRVKLHMRDKWVVVSGFRDAPLETHVRITLDARGNVLDTEIERRSGNPWYDDGVLTGIAKASPFPPPPEPGEWPFIFTPEDSL